MQDRKASEKRIDYTSGNLFLRCGNEPVEILQLLSCPALMDVSRFHFYSAPTDMSAFVGIR